MVEQTKQWITGACDETHAPVLSSATGLPLSLCRLLLARGYDSPEAVDAFLNPRLSALSDPYDLPGMGPAVERLARALASGRPIVVFGDYDVDGITSTALMVRVLSALGGKPVPFLPHRVDDGYGLGIEPLMRCLDEHQPDCVITVDCGTSSVEAVEAAQARGVDVIVTDHHEPGSSLAPAYAVVNPKLNAANETHHTLAGVGVAFKVCHALLKYLREQGADPGKQPDLRSFMELVAIGTVADMVPLTGENRALVRHGLNELNRTTTPGLKALMDVAGIKGPVDTYHIGFLLGPRLNAAGRLGTALASLELLLNPDEPRVRVLAEELDTANRERQTLEAEMVEQAFAQIDAWYKPSDHFGLVASSKGWHPGVIGIVASRLCARYRRPVAVIAVDEEGIGKGSCRSIPAFHMVEGLTEAATHLRRFGGHPMAAGLEIHEKHIASFCEAFNEAARNRLRPEDFVPTQQVDAWLSLGDVDDAFMAALDRLGPFGLGNTKPVWAARNVRLLGSPKVVGEKHLKMTFLDGNARLDAIAFGMADREIPAGTMDVAFYLNRNEFRGRVTNQMVVQDIRPPTM
jgi:single-stranded-DNA-specific exonuclease